MVLDGQQRLQSFYLALKGSIDGQVLHFNLLSGAESINEEIRYHFEFKDDKNHVALMAMSEIIYTKNYQSKYLVNV
ncbi:hypothetical protein J4731_07315 [Providencia rettgeri]|nr:hypothetical protein [Providencia rettgeri]